MKVHDLIIELAECEQELEVRISTQTHFGLKIFRVFECDVRTGEGEYFVCIDTVKENLKNESTGKN